MMVDDKIVKMQIWDTAGQEAFRSITRIFYRNSHCVLLTFDITIEETFLHIEDWVKEVRQNSDGDIKLYLIGNRADLDEDREVTSERAIELCELMKIDRYFETSAKTGYNVEEMFAYVGKQLYHRESLKNANEQDNEEEEEQIAPGSLSNERNVTEE